jgi:DNA-dependent RNA polymerase auxiliary subunit epsilon
MQISDVTIVIPTSYIPSHPSTKVIEETIKNTRFHFPDNEIILQIDGMRQEQIMYEKEYIERIANKLLDYQKQNAVEQWEKDYLDRCQK